MENKPIIVETKKDWGKRIALGALGLIALPFIALPLADLVMAKQDPNQYLKAVTSWETEHQVILDAKNKILKAECESGKKGAGLKLVAEAHGELKLENEDYLRLRNKRDGANGVDCEKVF